MLLERPHFSDYEAYPIVFLFRHAFELNLKNIIYKSALLCAFRRIEDIDLRLYNRHELGPIAHKAHQILMMLFPQDQELKSVAGNLLVVAGEISLVDSNSYSFRYPIRRDGRSTVENGQRVNLADLSSKMNGILDQLEVIDFGLDLTTDVAKEIYRLLESVTAEDEGGHLDEEERALAESFERGEWRSVKNV